MCRLTIDSGDRSHAFRNSAQRTVIVRFEIMRRLGVQWIAVATAPARIGRRRHVDGSAESASSQAIELRRKLAAKFIGCLIGNS
jgi:hypothetical protein